MIKSLPKCISYLCFYHERYTIWACKKNANTYFMSMISDCSILTYCEMCNESNDEIKCTKCKPGFSLKGNSCEGINWKFESKLTFFQLLETVGWIGVHLLKLKGFSWSYEPYQSHTKLCLKSSIFRLQEYHTRMWPMCRRQVH